MKSKEVRQTKAYYEKFADEWSNSRTHSFRHESQFVSLLKFLSPRASVIDIGCANGLNVPLFLGIGKSLKYTGLDISTSFLKIARRRYPQLTFLEGDITDKSTLPEKKFDGFFAAATLMHTPLNLWDAMLGNIETLSKSGAVGYITLPTISEEKDNPNDIRHFTILSPKEYEKYFIRRGWKILEKNPTVGPKRRGWRYYIVQLPS